MDRAREKRLSWALRRSKKPYGKESFQSSATACTSRSVFPEHKRRENNSARQEIARKIERFSDFRSPLPLP